MAEPTGFTPEQLEQLHEIAETIPGAATVFAIATMLGWPTSDPDARLQDSVYNTESHVLQLESSLTQWGVDIGTKLDQIITNQISHGDVLAAINQRVQDYLPVSMSGVPSAAAVATAVWDTAISIHIQANTPLTARQALTYAGKQQYIRHLYSAIPLMINPDFALAQFENSRWLPAYSGWNPQFLRPRARPLGETVLAYLQRVQPSAGWYADGAVCIRDLTSPGGGIVASLVCLLSDLSDDPPEADEGAGEPIDLEPVLERLRLYMPLPGEGTPGVGVVIAGEGRAALEPDTAAVLIDLAGIPEGWGRDGSDDPFYSSLGLCAFLSGGGFAASRTLHREANWLAVPPGADEVWWLLRPNIEGGLTFIIVAAE